MFQQIVTLLPLLRGLDGFLRQTRTSLQLRRGFAGFLEQDRAALVGWTQMSVPEKVRWTPNDWARNPFFRIESVRFTPTLRYIAGTKVGIAVTDPGSLG